MKKFMDINPTNITSDVIRGFEFSILTNASGIEIAAQCNQDNSVYVFPDMLVDRLTGREGFFSYYSDEDVAELNIGSSPVFKLQQVVDQVLLHKAELPEDFQITIHINCNKSVQAVCNVVRGYIKTQKASPSFFNICSNSLLILKQVQSALPMLKRYVKVQTVHSDYAFSYTKEGVQGIYVDNDFADLCLVRDALARGLDVRVFNVKTESYVARLADEGVKSVVL